MDGLWTGAIPDFILQKDNCHPFCLLSHTNPQWRDLGGGGEGRGVRLLCGYRKLDTEVILFRNCENSRNEGSVGMQGA